MSVFLSIPPPPGWSNLRAPLTQECVIMCASLKPPLVVAEMLPVARVAGSIMSLAFMGRRSRRQRRQLAAALAGALAGTACGGGAAHMWQRGALF